MVSDVIKNNKAYQYAINSLENENVGVYVKKQCKEFLKCLEEESEYYIDEKELNALCGFLSLINIMPNKNANENLAGFQYFFIINALCVRRKSNKKRRYELSIMLIARKNGKTMLSSLIFLLLMLMANPRSEFYSVSADRDLAGQLYKEFVKILDNSPNVNKFFKVLRNEIRCTINNSVYKVLALSNNRLDGRLATAWLADEARSIT